MFRPLPLDARASECSGGARLLSKLGVRLVGELLIPGDKRRKAAAAAASRALIVDDSGDGPASVADPFKDGLT